MSIVHTIVLAVSSSRERRELRTLLDADPRLRVVAAAGTRAVAGDLLRALAPDAAVIDLGLLTGCEFPLHGWGPVSREVALVAIGNRDDERLAAGLRSAGLAAYVPAVRLHADLPDAVAHACRPPVRPG